jgi:cytochrome P450
MTQVTMWVIAETMFGTDATHTAEIEEVVRRAQAITIAETAQPLPKWLAGKRLRDAAHINDVLTQLVKRIVSEREEASDEERGDLLTLLLQTRDEDGNPMSERWIRDNILTLFLAGHETTAHTLTWVLYYLDQNPQVAAKLREEVDHVLDGSAPTMADVPNLKYTEMVIKESMRVEPTVAAVPRYILEDVELGGYQLKKHSVVFMPLYVLHHDSRWWKQPEQFDPERFSAENEPNIPKYAYLPFGGGPRVCIGNHFAMMEAQILLASFVSRYTFSTVPGQDIHPLRMITTVPKDDIRMRVERRK